MTDEELERLILDHYVGESQTLTSEAEANLLRFKSLIDQATADDLARWEEITKAYRRGKEFAGGGDDPAALAATQLIKLNEQLGDLTGATRSSGERQGEGHRDLGS